MPLTPSNSIALGTKAAPFSLPDSSGVRVGLHDFTGAKAVLVAFISNRCPYVKLIREEFAAFARDYAARGLQVIAINANAPTGRDLRAAADRLLAGEASPHGQIQSIGCNIKWRPGNEPEYALTA